jgi:hypothetical protein
VTVSPAGHEPRWSSDGREILFRDGERLMTAGFSVEGSEPHLTPPRLRFEAPVSKTFHPVPGNGDVIALVELPGSGIRTSLSIVQNWFTELVAAGTGRAPDRSSNWPATAESNSRPRQLRRPFLTPRIKCSRQNEKEP